MNKAIKINLHYKQNGKTLQAIMESNIKSHALKLSAIDQASNIRYNCLDG